MRIRNESRFTSYWQNVDVSPARSKLLLLVSMPIIIMKVLLIGMLAVVIVHVAVAYPRALDQVLQKVREAKSGDKTGNDSTRMKGGEFRQAGYERRGSLIRPGGLLSSDDLRRRLDELRTTGSRSTACCVRNGESHYGKQ